MFNLKKLFDLKRSLLKFIYRLLIFKVIIIDKSDFISYCRLNTLCELELGSNLGPIKFIFKEDRRKLKRSFGNFGNLKSFIVELKIPDQIVMKRSEINELIVVVFKFWFCKINYPVFTEVLLDVYLDAIIKHIESNIGFSNTVMTEP